MTPSGRARGGLLHPLPLAAPPPAGAGGTTSAPATCRPPPPPPARCSACRCSPSSPTPRSTGCARSGLGVLSRRCPGRGRSTAGRLKRMAKARVAVLKTKPETVLADVGRTMEMADSAGTSRRAPRPSSRTTSPGTTRSPAANTTPWQLEGTILALARRGFTDQVVRAEQDRRHQRLQGRGPEPLRPDLQAVRRSRSSTTSRTRT